MQERSEQRYQLIALWAFAEVALGGMLHAFRMPFTGILVGGIAVSVVTLIGRTSALPWAEISKATVLVILVKAGASPHAPLPAYLAVAFQGFFGALIFQFLGRSHLAVIFFALIAMLESALQKLILMSVLYGRALWEAFDIFTSSVLHSFHLELYGTASQWAIALYLGIYFCFGLFLGYRLIGFDRRKDYYMELWKGQSTQKTESLNIKIGQPRRSKHLFWLIYLFVIFGMSVTLALLGDNKHNVFYIVFRSLAAIVVVFGVVNPLFSSWINKKSSNSALKDEIEVVSLQFGKLKLEFARAISLLPGSLWCPMKYFRAMEMLITLKLHIESTRETP